MRGALKVYDGQEWKPTGVVINQDITQYVSPFNFADNSDFTQFVAQAGIGGNHGSQAYGGDRWILDSGTITGTARADGNGYENVTLNGVIRQIVANPPATGTVGVDMVSGTATATYANGEITITSAGGVLKNVYLYEGTYEAGAAPKYQPKGYGVVLAECLRYLSQSDTSLGQNIVGTALATSGTRVMCFVPMPVIMRVNPTIAFTNIGLYKSSYATAISINNVTDIIKSNNGVRFLATVESGLTDGEAYYVVLKTNGYFQLAADLE